MLSTQSSYYSAWHIVGDQQIFNEYTQEKNKDCRDRGRKEREKRKSEREKGKRQREQINTKKGQT